MLRELDGVENRRARFRTCVTLILHGEEHHFEGIMEGRIALQRQGTDGFGYDPVFLPGADALPQEVKVNGSPLPGFKAGIHTSWDGPLLILWLPVTATSPVTIGTFF